MAIIGLIFLAIIFIIALTAAGTAAVRQEEKTNMSLKKAYLYLVSVISLVIAVVGAIMLINLALKAWVFTKADQNYYSVPCTVAAAPGEKNTGCDPATQAVQQKQAEDNRTAQRQNTAAQAIAMIVVATPVWYYHWRLARKEV
jgi:hypothetical protein